MDTFYQILLFIFLLGGVSVFVAGITNSVVVYYDLKDMFGSLFGVALPAAAYFMMTEVDVFFFYALLGPMLGLIGIYLFFNSIVSARSYNKSGWFFAIIISIYKFAFSSLFVFITASYVVKVIDKNTPLRDVILFTIAFAVFTWLSRGLINGEEVYDKKGWEYPASKSSFTDED